MEVNDTIISKIKKLAALADRGVDGEAENAKYLLDKLLFKYGITLEEVFSSEGEKREYVIRYKSAAERQIVVQCVANLFGSKSEEWNNFYRYRNGKSELIIKLTKAKWIILEDFVNFHLNNFRYELEKMTKNFYYSYLENQHLWNKDKDDTSHNKKSKYDEMVDWATIIAYSNSMKNSKKYEKKIEQTPLSIDFKE